ncbi:MAG: hypothetical protein NTY89_01515 [Nostocales cyanobacterium LacPavin_0920_SED1_MAG_38_18]|nr:hypothetical protein [Nostocales cyanobacterium LacPavin_0920_SED1_MAG_38_18]
MYNIKVQINHKETITINELVLLLLFNQIGEKYDLEIDEIQNYFSFESLLMLPNETFNSIFNFELPELPLRDITEEKIVLNFLESLKKKEDIISIVKLNDTILQEKAIRYYKEIIDLEMDMRNILTYILNYDNKKVDENLLKEFDINKSETYPKEQAEKHYENPLFYIYFNHYANFSQPKQLTNEKISQLLQDPTILTFDDFKRYLNSRSLFSERHIDFLLSIKTKLEPLEKIRNAVMHSRNISQKLIDNYYKVVNDNQNEKGIKSIIQEFWEQENEILKAQTWLALAKSQTNKILENSSFDEDNCKIIIDQCFINDILSNDILSDEYDDIELLINDLIDSVINEIEIKNYDVTEGDKEVLEELIRDWYFNKKQRLN